MVTPERNNALLTLFQLIAINKSSNNKFEHHYSFRESVFGCIVILTVRSNFYSLCIDF